MVIKSLRSKHGILLDSPARKKPDKQSAKQCDCDLDKLEKISENHPLGQAQLL